MAFPESKCNIKLLRKEISYCLIIQHYIILYYIVLFYIHIRYKYIYLNVFLALVLAVIVDIK